MDEATLDVLRESLVDMAESMQVQAAYWLDAREQLLMDAEMHHKMIGSLVGYAKLQHDNVGKNVKTKANKKKKPK